MVPLIIFISILCFVGSLANTEHEKYLEARLSRTEADLKELRDDVNILKLQNKALLDAIGSRNKKEKRLLLGPTSVHHQYVTFYARLLKPYTTLNDRETIVFESVVTNAGQGYDGNTGIFVCPVSGFYQFASTIVSESGTDKNIDAELMHNGQQIAHLHATLYGYDEGTQIANIHCAQGERVWIRHLQGAGDSRRMPAGYSSFSGALLSADSP
ncbi:complement C1q-like protein 4 [Saccostrea echinata]|uniref:complement C1q-like protein 4 n=1 Tax=Saccostrea echinata TaxID=191078 RepID=UPI002A806372|nr:complement C1q-like protein 4 [Saccostrea echinata]